MTHTLDPVDYWRLRALSGDWMLTKHQLATQLNAAKATHDAAVAVVAAKYGFDAAAAFTLHDETCAIEVPAAPPSADQQQPQGPAGKDGP